MLWELGTSMVWGFYRGGQKLPKGVLIGLSAQVLISALLLVFVGERKCFQQRFAAGIILV